MSEKFEFVRNVHDLSTDRGFQFEFLCDRCSIGFRSSFRASATGGIKEVLDVAGGWFGGIFGNASDVSHRVHSASWQKARDKAYQEALKELAPDFIQCPRCNAWVCRKKCWNDKKGLCKGCAPDLGVEMSAAQANKSVEEVWAHAAMAEEDKKLSTENWRENIRASCPECEAPLASNAKFCPACGAKLKVKQHCTECGAVINPGSKFCAECGAKQS